MKDTAVLHLEAFANVFLNKNVLEAAIGAWRDLKLENISVENKNYRFVS